ncbi:MAG: proton-conducting transporter membrane subunit [Caldilineaceae bacterium]|jgi:formate hydrogenlyase subunit 3/multisubunit Na+/H+ antiporter MnhD subunit
MNPSDIHVTSMPGLLIGVLLLTAVITYLLRGWERVTAIIGAAVTAGLAIWLWPTDPGALSRPLASGWMLIDVGDSLQRLGFTLRMEAGAIPILAVSLGLVAVSFILAANVSQGRSFVPFALALTAGYVVLALVTVGPLAPSLIVPLLLAVLAASGVFVLQAGRSVSASGPLRSLFPPLLAFPLFLLASWYIEQMPLNPQDLSPAYASAQLMALGLIILLAPMPLHGAMPLVSKNSPPIAAALLTLLYQLAVLHLIFRAVTTFQFMAQFAPLGVWLTWAGLLTAVWGGFAGAGARNAGRLVGYSSMHDWGLIVLVLAVPGSRSWPLVLFLFGLRTISLMTASAGMAVLEQNTGGLDRANLQGAGSRMPWNSAAFLIGGLGLTGFPLSAGFTGHWAALQIVAETDWRPAAVVLIASAGAILGYVRLARVLFGPLENRTMPRENSFNIAIAVTALIVSISFAMAPQLLDLPISRALVAFSQ